MKRLVCLSLLSVMLLVLAACELPKPPQRRNLDEGYQPGSPVSQMVTLEATRASC